MGKIYSIPIPNYKEYPGRDGEGSEGEEGGVEKEREAAKERNLAQISTSCEKKELLKKRSLGRRCPKRESRKVINK